MAVVVSAVLVGGCGNGGNGEGGKLASSLYVLESKGGTLSEGTGESEVYILTLTGVSPSATVFHDRPIRDAETMGTGAFIAEWDTVFADYPPNAALTFDVPEQGVAVFTLDDPSYDAGAGTLSFRAEDLPLDDGGEAAGHAGAGLSGLPANFEGASLFIDGAGDEDADGDEGNALDASAVFSSREGTEYDTGIGPSVAVNNKGVAVEVHESDGYARLWYHVGVVENDRYISWGASHQHDTGVAPEVALRDDGTVVEVHMSENRDSLWYKVGAVDVANRTISWGESKKYDTGGSPMVAMQDDGTVVEVHQSGDTGVGLWYHVGTVDPAGKSVSWGESREWGTGSGPAVALSGDGTAVEVHAGAHAARVLVQRGGGGRRRQERLLGRVQGIRLQRGSIGGRKQERDGGGGPRRPRYGKADEPFRHAGEARRGGQVDLLVR